MLPGSATQTYTALRRKGARNNPGDKVLKGVGWAKK